ncbi:MAG TPA: oligosaccharide flippase family protein [Chloroflexota bacterium]
MTEHAPVRNGILNASANAVSSLTAAIGSILIVRTLTTESYGTFSYYLWLASVLATVGTLAFPNALTKITSELRGRQQDAEGRALALLLGLALAALNLLLGVGLVFWAGRSAPPTQTYLLVIALTLAPSALGAVLRSALWGHERYTLVTVTAIVAALAQLGLTTLVYLAGGDAAWFLAAVLSTRIVQTVGMLAALWLPRRRRAAVVRPRLPSVATLRHYLSFALPATLLLLLGVAVFERSEVFFLERFSGVEQVGFFSLAFSGFNMMILLGWALVNGFYPAISRDYGAQDWNGIPEKVQHGLLLSTLYAVPLTLGGWATLDGIVEVLYGAKMLPAVPVAQAMFVGLLPGVAVGLLVGTLSAAGGVWLVVRLGAVMSAVNIALDLLLIPGYGAVGGAIAMTVTRFLYASVLLVAAMRLYQVRLPTKRLVVVVVVGLATTFALPMAGQRWAPGPFGLLLSIGVAATLYLALIRKLGYFAVLGVTAPFPIRGNPLARAWRPRSTGGAPWKTPR